MRALRHLLTNSKTIKEALSCVCLYKNESSVEVEVGTVGLAAWGYIGKALCFEMDLVDGR